jgi:uncharacterized membrane protein
MDPAQLALYSLTRILHVGTAIVLVGGTFFIRFLLMPAAIRELPEAEHDRLRAALMGSWKKFIHGGIGLLLLSGGINYWRVISSQIHKGDPLYHALLGTKILLAIALFFIASALVGRAPGFQGMRNNARKWMGVNLLLALIIVAISGFLRVRDIPKGRVTGEPTTAQTSNR